MARAIELVRRDSITGEAILPVSYTFEDICVTSVKKVQGEIVKKPLLKNVSGLIKAGDFVAIMGPSGCGKTTLLDCLARRKFPGIEVTGTMLLNGVENSRLFRRYVAYVMDNAPLMGTFTVYETILFSAMCNLPPSVALSKKITKVRRLIEEMGLEGCQNTKVGDVFTKGLSSGQKRRLSIACELVANPSVVFLDEPTSGLDSAASIKVMEQIVKLTHRGYAIICTIHQPSSNIWTIFDKLMLLTRGQAVYFGKASEAVDHFSSIGYSCPGHYNPADYFIQLINSDFEGHVDINFLSQQFIQSSTYQQVLQNIQIVSKEHLSIEKEDLDIFKNSFFNQFLILSKRNLQNHIRNPGIYGVRLAMYSIICLIAGFLFWNVEGKYDHESIISRASLVFAILSFLVFMSVAVLPFMIVDRAVFFRERSNGYYAIPAYVLSQFLTSLPGLFLIALISSICIVFPSGLNNFGIYLVDLFLSLVVAENLMMLLSVLIPHYIIGIALGSAIFGVFMLCEGFLIVKDDIPPYFVWLHYMAFHTYSLRVFMVNEFKDISNFTSEFYSSGEDVLSYYGMGSAKIWEDLIILVGFAVAFQLVVIFVLVKSGI